MDSAIEVLVIKRVFIMPDSGRGVGHFVADEPNTIVARIRLDPVNRCARPSPDSRLHSRGRTVRAKREVRRAADKVLTVGGVVKHVAFSGMRLAPRVLVRGGILRLDKIGCALVHCCVQVIDLHKNPMCQCVCGGVYMSAVVIGV